MKHFLGLLVLPLAFPFISCKTRSDSATRDVVVDNGEYALLEAERKELDKFKGKALDSAEIKKMIFRLGGNLVFFKNDSGLITWDTRGIALDAKGKRVVETESKDFYRSFLTEPAPAKRADIEATLVDSIINTRIDIDVEKSRIKDAQAKMTQVLERKDFTDKDLEELRDVRWSVDYAISRLETLMKTAKVFAKLDKDQEAFKKRVTQIVKTLLDDIEGKEIVGANDLQTTTSNGKSTEDQILRAYALEVLKSQLTRVKPGILESIKRDREFMELIDGERSFDKMFKRNDK